MLEEGELEFSDTGEDEDDDTVLANSFTPMLFSTMQRKVRDLMADYAAQELDPRPAFQRGYVWDKGRASRLVESILLNVPLPLVYTAEEEDGTEVVIDGQQRLLSVFGFIDGKFPKDGSTFRLSGLKLLTELNKKNFSDLDKKEQKAIKSYIFQIIKISADSHADVKFEIFERLNSGSVTLNAQELRNCVYRGPFNELLKDLSETQDFRSILGTSSATNRMQDIELVLRFLAFYERTYIKYNSGMKTFLNEFMDDYKNLSEKKSEEFKEKFRNAISVSFSIFGRTAFRKYGSGNESDPNGDWERPINRPLFDVLTWSFTQYDKSQLISNADSIREKLIEITETNPQFLDSITAATGDKFKTKYRFETWDTALKELIKTPTQNRTFSPELRRKLFQENPVCGICGQTIHTLDDSHVDHKVPYSRGGATKAENAQLTHRYCNLRKSANQAFG